MTQTDITPPEAIEPIEAIYWDATDAFLQSSSGTPSTDDLDALVETAITTHAPQANEAERLFHKERALRYIMGALSSTGLMGGQQPGRVLTWNTNQDEPERVRPLRAVTGVLASVLVASTLEELAAIEHMALPLAEQQALETALKAHFGTSKDAVSVCRFPFQAPDFIRLDVEDLLTDNLVAGLEGSELDFDQLFRQILLRRSPLSRVWKLADGKFGFVALWPVTVISMVASEYWQHGTSYAEALSEQISQILATALAERELLGSRVDMYGGHLYVGKAIREVADAIETDLVANGAKLRKLPARRGTAKIGRNLPCPCGSELKFKKCCGAD